MAPMGVGQRSDLLLWHNRIARGRSRHFGGGASTAHPHRYDLTRSPRTDT